MKKLYSCLLIGLLGAMVLCGCGSIKQEKKEVKNPVYIAEGIRKISIVKEGKETLQISYEPKDYEGSYEFWKIAVPYGKQAIVDTEMMLALYQQLESLDFSKTIQVDDLETTGLKDTETKIAMEFCQTNQEERDAVLQQKKYEKKDSKSYQVEADSSFQLLIGKKDGKGSYYTARKESPTEVYLMPEQTINTILEAKPFSFIIKVCAVANIENVKQVSIEMDGKQVEIEEKELKEKSNQELYKELLSLLVAGEVDEKQKLSKESLLHVTITKKKDAGDKIEMEYHPYDATYASVNINGVEKFLVKLSDLEKLKTLL